MNKPKIQWAMDFMHDALYCGKRLRTLNIIDEGTRECLAIEVDTSLPADGVIRLLECLKEERGQRQQIRVDHGPELMSVNLLNYCEYNDITLCHIQPGKPQQNVTCSQLFNVRQVVENDRDHLNLTLTFGKNFPDTLVCQAGDSDLLDSTEESTG